MTKIISFYQDTEKTDGFYEASAKRLRAECKAVGQQVSIVKRSYGHDYLSITKGKPLFMLEQLKKTTEDLIWVDVDSTVLKPFDFTYDTLAFAAKPNGKPYGHVIYLPNTEATIAFLEEWIARLEDWEGGDHSAMWMVLNQGNIPWTPIENVGTRVRFGIAQHVDRAEALATLDSIGWTEILKSRFADL